MAHNSINSDKRFDEKLAGNNLFLALHPMKSAAFGKTNVKSIIQKISVCHFLEILEANRRPVTVVPNEQNENNTF